MNLCMSHAGELPPHVTLTVAEAAPHMRGESASAQQKRAVMDNGAQVCTSALSPETRNPQNPKWSEGA